MRELVLLLGGFLAETRQSDAVERDDATQRFVQLDEETTFVVQPEHDVRTVRRGVRDDSSRQGDGGRERGRGGGRTPRGAATVVVFDDDVAVEKRDGLVSLRGGVSRAHRDEIAALPADLRLLEERRLGSNPQGRRTASRLRSRPAPDPRGDGPPGAPSNLDDSEAPSRPLDAALSRAAAASSSSTRTTSSFRSFFILAYGRYSVDHSGTWFSAMRRSKPTIVRDVVGSGAGGCERGGG